MIYALLVLLIGLSISGVAAFYSIVGLTTIFSGSVLAVAIMGSVLEVGKLITASWLYRNWKKAGFLMKSYLTIAVVVLMFITSMGIFGYLSKAHIQQTGVAGGTELQVELIDHKIAREQKQIADAESVIIQLDKAVEILMSYDRVRGPTGAIAVRQGQKEERSTLNNVIDVSSETIGDLQEKKIVLENSQLEMEVEVGPIKYIAELIYGEEEAKGLLDEAVRAVILILILVFDPLAVLLLIAASISFEQVSERKKEKAAPMKKEVAEVKENIPKTWDEHIDMHVDALAKQIGDDIDKEILQDLLPEISKEAAAELVKELHDEPKSAQIPDLQLHVQLHNGTYDDADEPEARKPDWADKIVSKPASTREELAAAVDHAFEEVKKSANIPFNLEGPAAELWKSILLDALTKDSEEKP